MHHILCKSKDKLKFSLPFSDHLFPTITSVDRIVIEKNSKNPVQLESDTIIKIRCPRSKSKVCKCFFSFLFFFFVRLRTYPN